MNRSLAIAILALMPAVAMAHPGHGHGGLGAGLMHPFVGLDHLLAMLGVGFWAARQGTLRSAAIVCTAFLVAVLVGFAVGVGQTPVHAVEFGIIASLLITGVLVFGARRLPLIAASGLAGLFALFHGHAHGAEMAAGLSAVAFGTGFSMATAILLAGGACAAWLVSRGNALRPVERVTGGVLVVSSVYLLFVV